MDELLIVKAKDVLRLAHFKKIWVLGWMVATAAVLVVGIQTARLSEADHQQQEIRELTTQLSQATERQAALNEDLVSTLEKQNQTADLLISWGSYVKARSDVARLNLNTPQFATVARPK